MADEGGGGVEELPSSPKNKIKFLCSHGGKILPRPADGNLKYVGGETRVLAVPRDITLSELRKRLSEVSDGEMVLKYQLISEDLDTLISVRNDEDLKHMLNEYDRQENQGGTPKLRTFLFPTKPTTITTENQTILMDPHSLEQRYIDAINGVVTRTTSRPKIPPLVINPPIFTISSACSSPNSISPERHNGGEASANEAFCRTVNMHKVQSSPTLFTPNSPRQNLNSGGTHRVHQQQYQNPPQIHHHYHQSSCSRPPIDVGRTELRRSLVGSGVGHWHHQSSRYQKGGCGGYYEDCCHRMDRAESLPRSPRKRFWEN
ncbi:hypothetical protein UlMin_030535 [Ulmus minor]